MSHVISEKPEEEERRRSFLTKVWKFLSYQRKWRNETLIWRNEMSQNLEEEGKKESQWKKEMKEEEKICQARKWNISKRREEEEMKMKRNNWREEMRK